MWGGGGRRYFESALSFFHVRDIASKVRSDVSSSPPFVRDPGVIARLAKEKNEIYNTSFPPFPPPLSKKKVLSCLCADFCSLTFSPLYFLARYLSRLESVGLSEAFYVEEKERCGRKSFFLLFFRSPAV